jgi:uncharacterized protein YfaS (alpha-2-macroglobulin family)
MFLAGKTLQKVKGFLYGERGVYRQGDSIYTIYFKRQFQSASANHPIEFEHQS